MDGTMELGMFSRQFMMSYFVSPNLFRLTINISVSWPTLVASALANEPSRADASRCDPIRSQSRSRYQSPHLLMPTHAPHRYQWTVEMHFVHREKAKVSIRVDGLKVGNRWGNQTELWAKPAYIKPVFFELHKIIRTSRIPILVFYRNYQV